MWLLTAGLLFPALSVVTCIASAATGRSGGRHASPVCIPLIGPVLLTQWILSSGHPSWAIPLVWLLDPGTVLLVLVLPRLIREGWRISVFTRVLTLRGAHGLQSVVLTLQRGGWYRLRKSWRRPPGECGIVELSEAGCYTDGGTQLILESENGRQRRLLRTPDGAFVVQETQDPNVDGDPSALHEWRLQV